MMLNQVAQDMKKNSELMFICCPMPDHNLPLIKFTTCSFKGIITDKEPGTINKGSQDRVGSNDNLDIALHLEMPNILFLWFIIFEIFLILINYTCESTITCT